MAFLNFLNRIFDSSSDTDKGRLDWISLTDLSQLEEAVDISIHRKVLIFKHSTRCGISSMVLRQFEKTFQPDEHSVLYFLDLLRHRDISNAIAERFNVTHQSPQILVIENGSCTRHASHHQIIEMLKD